MYKGCNKEYTDDVERGYDRGKNKIYVRKYKKYNRIFFVSDVIKFIIYSLVPDAKKVKYKGVDHILISVDDIDDQAVRFSSKVYDSIDLESWKKYRDNRREDNKEKKKRKSPSHRKRPSKGDLRYLYYDKKLTQAQIAELYDVHVITVTKWFKKYDLPGRGRKKYISPDKLEDLYYEQDFTIREIAKILEVDKMVVYNSMKEHGFEFRDKKMFGGNNVYSKKKAFRSTLRKKFRRNEVYVDIAEEVLEKAKKDRDLKMGDEEEDS